MGNLLAVIDHMTSYDRLTILKHHQPPTVLNHYQPLAHADFQTGGHRRSPKNATQSLESLFPPPFLLTVMSLRGTGNGQRPESYRRIMI